MMSNLISIRWSACLCHAVGWCCSPPLDILINKLIYNIQDQHRRKERSLDLQTHAITSERYLSDWFVFLGNSGRSLQGRQVRAASDSLELQADGRADQSPLCRCHWSREQAETHKRGASFSTCSSSNRVLRETMLHVASVHWNTERPPYRGDEKGNDRFGSVWRLITAGRTFHILHVCVLVKEHMVQ